MNIKPVPEREVNALANRLAIDLTINWETTRAELAIELDVTEAHLDTVMDDHRQHILNLSYNILSQAGKANN